jgi:PAS domain S-box-containing protein
MLAAMVDEKPLHILVIEDDPDTRANLRDILQLDGHRVETAASIADAVARSDWDDISAVILDRRLPDGSAVDLLPKVKHLAPNTPVIVVTGHPDIEQAIAALREGAYDYILKPINPDALRARMKRITERRHAERQLAESEARNRALLDAIPDTMLRMSRDGTILDFRAHRDSDVTEWPPDIVGSDIRRSTLPEDAVEKLKEAIVDALATETVRRVEYAMPHDGGTRFFEARIVKGGDDEVVAIVRDVTARKQAAGRALQAERLAAIGQMVAGLAHESRNAFQRSQACLEMLALVVEDRREALELVQRIQKAQDHLHYLYEEVRTYAAPIHLQHQMCDLAQVWRDTWTYLEVERSEKNVSLREQRDETDLMCEADPNALEQVFRNVLENAISACREPGEIVIRSSQTRIDGQEAVEIRVRDNGPGFDSETERKIFEPFFTTKTQGTGLGMAIARRIVEAHGGRIAVGEDSSNGAEIVITLPR